MSTRITRDAEQVRERFSRLQTREDVAELLEVPLKQLTYHLFRRGDPYIHFKIRKASGGDRDIMSPSSALKIIQRKLADVLNVIYSPKVVVHGFALNRSIVSNAAVHLGAKFVLNVDLKDFFPSINFGRVRGMFMAPPYKLHAAAATVLTQICCHENRLPQGAPTSPIVSNMLCGRLDSQLQKLARSYNCLYSRYADDLTFSTRTKQFPKSLARVIKTESGESVVAGSELDKIINENGFQINEAKTRLQTPKRRQEVTGLTINEFPNVKRRYISQLRAMLHAWKQHGPEAAEREFLSRYARKHRNPNRKSYSFARVVKGKINFLGMVRGNDDSTYIKFLQQYSNLQPGFKYSIVAGKRTSLAIARDALWVIECAYDDDDGNAMIQQGTAFALWGVGLVTCAHVVHPHAYAFKADEPSRHFPVTVKAKDENLDFAIVSVGAHHSVYLAQGDPSALRQEDHVRVLGYPNYNRDDGVFVHSGYITGFRATYSPRRILVDAHIVQGNSGGPVLNDANEVIGVAVTGSSNEGSAPQTEAHGVIPIDALQALSAKDAQRSS